MQGNPFKFLGDRIDRSLCLLLGRYAKGRKAVGGIILTKKAKADRMEWDLNFAELSGGSSGGSLRENSCVW